MASAAAVRTRSAQCGSRRSSSQAAACWSCFSAAAFGPRSALSSASPAPFESATVLMALAAAHSKPAALVTCTG